MVADEPRTDPVLGRYPYEQLGELRELAAKLPGGMVDLSVGSPVDPAPPGVRASLAEATGVEPYPASAGSVQFRSAAAAWMERRFGVRIDPAVVAASIGTKELIAGLPGMLALSGWLRPRRVERDTVLYPEISYPTYAVGALLAGMRAVPVAADERGGLDVSTISDEDAARAVVLWINSPANPTGALTDLEACARWGRERGVLVASDECYVELTWEGRPETILEQGMEGVVAVHSVSKRSSAAGLRAGFYAGDPSLVRSLSELRKHAGLMVPGPVQGAAAAALAAHEHAAAQREIYRARLVRLCRVFDSIGLSADLPAGGFYLWPAVPDHIEDAWALARLLAEDLGVVVSPGTFYGEQENRHVRVAATQPDSLIGLLEQRVAQRSAGRG